jgi:glycosyltransferase involved in cell wall biosynthesis
MIGRLNGDFRRWNDVFTGVIDWKESISKLRPRPNNFWRFLPENIERSSIRLRRLERKMPEHDTVIQIGVGGIPSPSKLFMGHAEISIQTAANLAGYSETYGFASGRNRLLQRAMEGEKMFLESCDVIWTNSEWTAETFAWAGISRKKFWIHPPACNCADPGPISRQWEAPHILFVGKDWQRKGGNLLVAAFKILQKEFPKAQLTIIGCKPEIAGSGITVLGFLDKKDESSRRLIDRAFKNATMFCMPSLWESTGLVYMEAALFGLPLIMLSGQGRDRIFPAEMALHLNTGSVGLLAEALISLARDPALLERMSVFGAEYVRANYTLGVVCERLAIRLSEVADRRTLAPDGC